MLQNLSPAAAMIGAFNNLLFTFQNQEHVFESEMAILFFF